MCVGGGLNGHLCYSKSQLLKLRPVIVDTGGVYGAFTPCVNSGFSRSHGGIYKPIHRLTDNGINKIPTLVSSRRSVPREWNQGVNLNNLTAISVTDIPLQKSSGLKVGLLNCQSVRNKIDQIHDLIIEKDLDILTLTETWLTPHEKDDFFVNSLELVGYEYWGVPRKGSCGYGGGIGFVFKTSLKTLLKSSQDLKTLENGTIRFIFGSKCLDITVVYRPPPSPKNGLTVSGFFEEFPEFLQSMMLGGGDQILVGDINFHIEKETDSSTSRFVDLLDSVSLKQLVKGPTHRSGHTLDIFVVRECEGPGVTAEVHDLVSDHHLIIGTIKYPKPTTQRKNISIRKYGKIDVVRFRGDIANAVSEIDLSDYNVQSGTKSYYKILRSLLDEHAPSKDKAVILRPQREWYCDKLHHAKAVKRKAERLWRSSGSVEHHEQYASLKHEYNDMIEVAKTSHFSTKLAESDPKAVQSVLDELLFRKQVPKLPDRLCDLDLANRFAAFFRDKVEKIRINLPQVHDGLDFDVPRTSAMLSGFRLVTSDEVRRLVIKSPSKSCDLDPLPTWLLKESIEEILPLVVGIVNNSLSSATVPSTLKTAVVTPLLKKASLDSECLKNYRPVSNLPFLGKILEKVVVTQLNSYLNDNNLHEVLQSAYKPNHSTETALLKIQNDILAAVDKKGVVILILLDLSAAFDLIDHDILLERMNSLLGISGSALDWFRSYLSERTQRVRIGKAFSVAELLRYCVPQGSVLGPMLFLIYILPLGALLRKHGVELHGYADDTQIYLELRPITQENADMAVSKLESCLGDVYTWMSSNKLKLNSGKTEVIVIGPDARRSKVQFPPINIAGCLVNVGCETVTNLGVVFDETLSLKQQVAKVVKGANYHLRNIRRIRRYLTEKAAQRAVVSLVLSRLDYCNSLLSGLPACLIRRLQIVQNSAARVVKQLGWREHITPTLKELHWLPVVQRVKYKVLVIVYNCVGGSAPKYLQDMFVLHKPARSLRSGQDSLALSVPRTLSSYGDRALSACGPRLWNALPVDLRMAPSVACFKRNLKTHLFRQAFN